MDSTYVWGAMATLNVISWYHRTGAFKRFPYHLICGYSGKLFPQNFAGQIKREITIHALAVQATKGPMSDAASYSRQKGRYL